jgi:prepilin-type N-terminal cleavage/methylation domain-containing protein
VSRRGFSLIEVLIAMVIMVGGMVVVGSSWSGNLLRVRKSALYNNVAFLLERKAAELEAKYKGKPLTEIEDEEGDFGSDFPQYKWNFKTQPFAMPDLTPVLTSGNKSVDQNLLSMMTQMQEFFGKAILEGKITIVVTVGTTPMEFSVTTYFVDYALEPSLPGGGGGN